MEAGSAVLESLQNAGFSPSDEPSDDADDEDGNTCPPPGFDLAGGHSLLSGIGSKGTLLELESFDVDSCSRESFLCAYSGADGIFYAQPKTGPGTDANWSQHRVTKGAVAAMVDVADSFLACKIAIGLSNEHAACSGFVRALLSLGFSVAPSVKKSVFNCSALVLELVLASEEYDDEYDSLSDASTSCDEEYYH